jgi:hypothetical protein
MAEFDPGFSLAQIALAGVDDFVGLETAVGFLVRFADCADADADERFSGLRIEVSEAGVIR